MVAVAREVSDRDLCLRKGRTDEGLDVMRFHGHGIVLLPLPI